jgi:hypothetical protein
VQWDMMRREYWEFTIQYEYDPLGRLTGDRYADHTGDTEYVEYVSDCAEELTRGDAGAAFSREGESVPAGWSVLVDAPVGAFRAEEALSAVPYTLPETFYGSQVPWLVRKDEWAPMGW